MEEQAKPESGIDAGIVQPPAGFVERSPAEVRRVTLFEERYGPGSHQRLLAWLQRPCVTFAQIADRFSVTRERVRQWHAELLPDAPSGLERRRQCAAYRQRQRLLGDALFRAFFRHVRERAPASRVEPVVSASGYRTRVGRLDGHLVALRDASHTAAPQSGSAVMSYRLVGYRGEASYVYFLLTADAFLVVPVTQLPLYGASFVDDGSSRYEPFKNRFAAATGDAAVHAHPR